ncbi:MAG: hypothetical protein D6739_01400 [Nitrospirae bacterium]|nr:MAG: hypothetical protein D6739_01400 [Nitrospirota bacterium]
MRNLGLFYRVSGEVRPAGPGRVALTVRVAEKWAILPLPQLDITEEGDVKVGLDYTDYNFRGEDQQLNVKFKHAFGTDPGGQAGESGSVSLAIPQLGETPYDARASLGIATNNEVSARSELTGTRGSGATSVDLDLDVGRFQRIGTARRRTGIGFTVNYVTGNPRLRWVNSLRLRRSVDAVDDFVYTFRGHRAGAEVQLFSDLLGSRASAAKLSAAWTQYWKRGEHNLVGKLSGGYTLGPDARDVGFEIGGGRSVRGIDKESLVGAGMWLVNVEYRTPRAWEWLGGATFLDVGAAGSDLDLVRPDHMAAGVGVGLRAYIGRLVKGVARLDLAVGTGPDGAGGFKVYFGLKQPL